MYKFVRTVHRSHRGWTGMLTQKTRCGRITRIRTQNIRRGRIGTQSQNSRPDCRRVGTSRQFKVSPPKLKNIKVSTCNLTATEGEIQNINHRPANRARADLTEAGNIGDSMRQRNFDVFEKFTDMNISLCRLFRSQQNENVYAIRNIGGAMCSSFQIDYSFDVFDELPDMNISLCRLFRSKQNEDVQQEDWDFGNAIEYSFDVFDELPDMNISLCRLFEKLKIDDFGESMDIDGFDESMDISDIGI